MSEPTIGLREWLEAKFSHLEGQITTVQQASREHTDQMARNAAQSVELLATSVRSNTSQLDRLEGNQQKQGVKLNDVERLTRDAAVRTKTLLAVGAAAFTVGSAISPLVLNFVTQGG